MGDDAGELRKRRQALRPRHLGEVLHHHQPPAAHPRQRHHRHLPQRLRRGRRMDGLDAPSLRRGAPQQPFDRRTEVPRAAPGQVRRRRAVAAPRRSPGRSAPCVEHDNRRRERAEHPSSRSRSRRSSSSRRCTVLAIAWNARISVASSSSLCDRQLRRPTRRAPDALRGLHESAAAVARGAARPSSAVASASTAAHTPVMTNHSRGDEALQRPRHLQVQDRPDLGHLAGRRAGRRWRSG